MTYNTLTSYTAKHSMNSCIAMNQVKLPLFPSAA
jgi:hypothetical protein